MTQITLPADRLRAALSPVSHLTKSPLSGSQATLLPRENDLVIYASTYSAACETSVTADIQGNEGPVIVDYDRLCRLVDREQGDVTLTLAADKTTIKGTHVSATLQATSGDYLRRPSPCITLCEVAASALREAVGAVDHAADPPKSARESFRVIVFELTDDLTLRLSATDGLIAAIHEIDDVQPALEVRSGKWLVPIDLAKSLLPILAMRAEPIRLGVSENDATFHLVGENLHWETATFSATPPNLAAMREQWEDMGTFWVIVDRAEFLAAVRAAALFEIRTENDRWAKVTVACDKPSGTIGVTANSSAGECTITVPGDFDESFTFAATADHLIRAANAYHADELNLRVTKQPRGILVSPSDSLMNVHLLSPITR